MLAKIEQEARSCLAGCFESRSLGCLHTDFGTLPGVCLIFLLLEQPVFHEPEPIATGPSGYQENEVETLKLTPKSEFLSQVSVPNSLPELEALSALTVLVSVAAGFAVP